MPVAARTVNHVGLVTFIAFIKGHAIGAGAAVDNGFDDLLVGLGHGGAKLFNIFWAELFENLINGRHDRIPS